MKKMLQEFKEFAISGNVADMAIGVIVGAAFKSIVDSLVNDVISPLLGVLIGEVSFTDLAITLKGEGESAVVLKYGNFIQNILNFLIVAFTLFMVVKMINKLKNLKKKEEEPAEEEVKEDPENIKLLREIAESLKNR